jgi:hypothetical protein
MTQAANPFIRNKSERWRFGLDVVARICKIRGNSAEETSSALNDCAKFLEENGFTSDGHIDAPVVALVDMFLDSGNLADAPEIKFLDVAVRDVSVKNHLRTFVRACQVRGVRNFPMVFDSWRVVSGRTIRQIATALGVSVPKVKMWLRRSSGFSSMTPHQALHLDHLLGADWIILAAYAALSQHTAFQIAPPILDKILGRMTFARLLRQLCNGLSKRGLLVEVARITGIYVSEADFSRWLNGRLPSRDKQKAIQAIDKICNAGGQLVDAWEKECPQIILAPYKFPESEWPKYLGGQRKRITLYKTTNPERLKRSKGRGSDKWDEVTQEIFLGFSERFFGRILQRTDPAGKPLFNKDTLSFSLMCDFENIEDDFEFIRQRVGRTGQNTSEYSELGSLLNLWTWFFPHITADVQGEPYWQGKLPPEKVESLCLGPGLFVERRTALTTTKQRWAEQLRLTVLKAREYLKKHDFPAGPLDEKIRSALEADVDLGAIAAELEPQVNEMPMSTTTRKTAIKWRDLAAAALSWAGIFRPETVRQLELEDVLPIHHQVQAGIAADKFKTRGKGGSKGGVHRTLSDLPWVYKALQGWIKHGRPFLLKEALARGEKDAGHLFVAAEVRPDRVAGGPLSANELAMCIKRVLGYAPYGQRYLFANLAWVVGITLQEIANVMGNTPPAARIHYQKLAPEQRMRRGQTAFTAFLKKGGKRS